MNLNFFLISAMLCPLSGLQLASHVCELPACRKQSECDVLPSSVRLTLTLLVGSGAARAGSFFMIQLETEVALSAGTEHFFLALDQSGGSEPYLRILPCRKAVPCNFQTV